MQYRKFSYFFFLLVLSSYNLSAQRIQRDTSGTGSVDIISSFKPTLRDPVKIQFGASIPPADTNRISLNYRIPSQELSISYQPGTLKPLAFQPDSTPGFTPAQYAKLGYGSLRNPYASLALSFGKRSPILFYAGHQSASGNRPDQDYSITNGSVLMQLPHLEKGEWRTGISFDRQAYNKYGYDTARPKPVLDSIRQVFHQIEIQVGYRRKQPTSTGFYVEPVLDWRLTGDRNQNQDLHARLYLPIRYTFNSRLSFRLNGLVHWGMIRPDGKSSINQSVYSLNPVLQVDWPKWSVQAGVRPSWDQAGLRMYPDLKLQWSDPSKSWNLRAQWMGELQRTGYRELYTMNPWLWMPSEWRNRGYVDRSILWQYNRRAHWIYEVQLGYATLRDAFLFVNDTSAIGDGKSFQTLYADRIQNFYARAKLSYRQADRWLVRAEAGWNHYHGLQGVEDPWGLLPFEWKLHALYRFPKQIRLQADLYSWFAPLYLTKSGQSSRTDGAFDLNLSAHMPITKYISGWLQFNNVLNQTYSRWAQYPAYGFHFVGGVVFSLDKSIY